MSTSIPIRPGGRSRPGRLVALLTATAVAASLLSAPSGPALATPNPGPATPPDPAAGLLPGGSEPVAVTLVTGDTVLWQDTGDGNPRLEIEQATRDYPVVFDKSGTQEDFYVIPTDVMQHVVAGNVDEELFNIPGLIRQGLADTATDELPVIVTFDHDRSTQQLARDADALPATTNATAIEKLNGAGVRVDRGKAGAFRKALFGEPGRGGSTRAASAEGLDGVVEQVLLDRVLTIDLADSVPQIGAPEAWDAGYTGDGITVAVVDTGIDANHPDLAGQVVAAANFTDEPDATDTHGHGTHVASTIAGTGAASDGARKGVAPGADLLGGKVCTADGKCQTSAIMAGMQWAAEQGADVVNMSLGGEPTDGTDPVSQLLNQLSADTGVLFVTSAGNNRTRWQVGSPAAADAALAVGAVDKSEQMASFSSRGPRVGDHAVKPEITAPGVGIVAARAEGTGIGGPVDDNYTALSGTSMAAPHVAGAAALLAQARGLTGQQLKDALVSTAADGGFRWYEQGTGRVDIPAALDSPIYASGTVNLGGIDQQAERDIVYTNRSDHDITLTLQAAATDFDGRAVDGVTLSTSTLTVPAHGHATATVTVVLDSSKLTGQEAFGGVVTATGGGVALRTGIGFGPPLHRVTIEVLDSNGHRIGTDTADDTFVTLTHDTLDPTVGGAASHRLFTSDGVAVGHVPAGTYTAITAVGEHQPGNNLDLNRGSLLISMEIVVSANSSITLDTRDSVPVTVSVPRSADTRNHQVVVIRELPGTERAAFEGVTGGSFPVYVTPTPPGKLAPLRMAVSWTLAEPKPLINLPGNSEELCRLFPRFCLSETPAYIYNLTFMYENGVPRNLHQNVAHRDLVEVPTRFHSDHTDALITQIFAPFLPFTTAFAAPTDVRISFRPGAVTEYFLADDRFSWRRFAVIQRFANEKLVQEANVHSDDWFPTAEAGARRGEERWHEAPLRVGMQEVREETLGWHVHDLQRPAAASRGGSDGNQFTAPFQVTGNTRGHGGSLNAGSAAVSWRMWNTDTGTELERSFSRVFQLAPGTGTYRLEQTENPLPTQPVRTGPATTTWTFTSQRSDVQVPPRHRCPIQQAPRQDVCQIQPLILLEYALGLDIHNRMSAGRAHRFTVTAGHHTKSIDRTPVTTMTVQASFDDGHTWQDARLVGKPKDTWDTGGLLPSVEPYQQFKVVLMIPPLHRTNGYVSLRVHATDANGGTVDQTIHRAYILK